MRIVALKIKIASLAAEGALIHHEENKHRSAARACERFARDPSGAVAAARRDLARAKEIQVETSPGVFIAVTVSCPHDVRAARHVLRLDHHRVANVGHALADAPKYRATFESLRDHRKGPGRWDPQSRKHTPALRSHTRSALLAYALIRGRSYAATEPRGSSKPDWDAVKDIAQRFGDAATYASFDAWQAAAENYRLSPKAIQVEQIAATA